MHLAVLVTIAHHIEVSSEYERGARPRKETLSMMMMMKISVTLMMMVEMVVVIIFPCQIIFPLIYVLIVYFMTAQPLDPARSPSPSIAVTVLT